MKLKVKPLPKPGYSGTLETVLRCQLSLQAFCYLASSCRAMIPIYMTFSMAQVPGKLTDKQ